MQHDPANEHDAHGGAEELDVAPALDAGGVERVVHAHGEHGLQALHGGAVGGLVGEVGGGFEKAERGGGLAAFDEGESMVLGGAEAAVHLRDLIDEFAQGGAV